jgi:hypothetical protein
VQCTCIQSLFISGKSGDFICSGSGKEVENMTVSAKERPRWPSWICNRSKHFEHKNAQNKNLVNFLSIVAHVHGLSLFVHICIVFGDPIMEKKGFAYTHQHILRQCTRLYVYFCIFYIYPEIH